MAGPRVPLNLGPEGILLPTLGRKLLSVLTSLPEALVPDDFAAHWVSFAASGMGKNA